MTKLTFEDWKNTMSFMIYDDFDNSFLRSIEPLINFMNQNSIIFSNHNKLGVFLTVDEDFTALVKLKALVSLIGLSEERLKRIVSLVRKNSNDKNFNSEWTIKQISKQMQRNTLFRESLVDFFINGRNSIIGKEVPLYYMRNFKLNDPEFIADLNDFRYVQRILNDNEIQGKYSNQVGAHVEGVIRNRLNEYRQKVNPDLKYEIQKEFSLLNKNVDFLIPSVSNPIIVIESSYQITTGSAQSTRADMLVNSYKTIFGHNANHPSNRIIVLNYCDGFGWVGRQRDLRRIYDASDFVFNQNNLNVLDEVLNEFYPNSSL